MTPEEEKDIAEAGAAMRNVEIILKHPDGRAFIKYLFKTLSVGDLPPQNLPTENHYEILGFLRAGKAVFELVSQADFTTAGLIFAENQKEKYDEIKTMDASRGN